MIVVMKSRCTSEQVDDVRIRLEDLGYLVTQISGVEKTILAAVGGEEYSKVDSIDQFKALEWVEEVMVITKPYRFVSREYRPESTVIDLGDGVKIGGLEVCMMAGPCTIESEEQLFITAAAVAKSGAKVLRGGAYKPSTSPYSYQGMGVPGLKLLQQAAKEFGLKVITEVMDLRKIDLVSEYCDILQIGTRNMQNYDLLRELGKAKRPVMIKRGMSAKYEEWLLAAEYVASNGNEQIMFCERGVRSFETGTRNMLDLAAVPVMKSLSHLPIVIDPSQGTGKRELVASMSLGAVAVGADGLLIEVHPNPDHAIKDGSQSMTIAGYEELLTPLSRVAEAVGRRMSYSNQMVK